MGVDIFEVAVNLTKMVVIFLLMVQIVPLLVWVERRGSAYIQNRFGPNRIGPLGLTQLLADAVKFLFKEEFVPTQTRRFMFFAAPIIALIPAGLALGGIPLSAPINIETFEMFGQNWGPYKFDFQTYSLGIGIVFILGVSSLGAYALLMAGWGSENKYSLLGALRASAQMISYELGLGLSIVGILLIFGTFDFLQIIQAQAGPLQFKFMGDLVTVSALPNWGIFYQPLGFLLFFISVFAETNRLPFDLPEAEGELVAGYHTEYGGIKMNMFYIGEYGHMFVASALLSIFYFGGYGLPIPGLTAEVLTQNLIASGYSNNGAAILSSVLLHLSLMTKVALFLWIFIWVRWTLPRFRYDQLMNLGWRTLLPWALFNTIATALVVYFANA